MGNYSQYSVVQDAFDCDTELHLDPVSLRSIFHKLLHQHYSNPVNYGGVPEEFKKMFLKDKGVKPNMALQLDYQFDNTTSVDVPSIYVGFGDFKFDKKVIDNYIDHRDDMSSEASFNLVQTPLILRHISETPDEALMLGTITTAFMHGIRKTIMRALSLKRFEVEALTKIQLVTGDKAFKQFECATQVSLVYQNTWETFEESQRIKKVNIGVAPV